MFKYNIKSINLKNFRNFDNLNLDFSKNHMKNPNGIFFIGENGIGKTSVLEAISMLYPGKGIRSAKYSEIIKNNIEKTENWSVCAQIHNNLFSNQINVIFENGKKNTFINGKKISKLSKILEHNCLIWVAQDDYHNFLISNSFRRNFFDRIFCSLEPSFIDSIQEYNHFLSEKQKLLKNFDIYGQNSQLNDFLSKLNKKLSELARSISMTRKNIIEKFNLLAPNSNFNLIPQIEIQENFDFENGSEETLKCFEDMKDQEIKMKRVLIGPHLSKIHIKEIKNQTPISILSSGEQRILLNNLIISQIQIYISSFSLYPIVLLDDILTFFDKNNQKKLIDMLLELNVQFFIATNILTDEIKNLDCQFFYL